jgi:hypothetical protein
MFAAPAEPFEEVFIPFTDSLFFPQPTVPPYDNFLGDRLAEKGIQDATVFVPADIDGAPRGVYLIYTYIPDPGTTGSSFAAGPIIPNRLFPITYDHDLLRNGVIVDPLAFDDVSPREQGFDGKAYESIYIVEDALYFPPGTELPGNYELRGVLRDREGNGWNIVAPFKVVPELTAGDFNQDGAVDAADYVAWRKGLGTIYTPADYDTWRAHFGQSIDSSGPLAASDSLPAVPEPGMLTLSLIVLLSPQVRLLRFTRAQQ